MSIRAMWIFTGVGLCIAFLVLMVIWRIGRWQEERAERKVVCLGDSLTAFGTVGGVGGRFSDYLQLHFPKYVFLNRGINGDTLAGGRNRFAQDVTSLRPLPKLVIIALGANDFHRRERPIEALEEDLSYMVGRARDLGIEVILAGVFGKQLNENGEPIPKRYPEGDADFGAQILEMERRVARKFDVPHLENMQAALNKPEHWSDPRHPSPAGNRVIAEALLPLVREALSKANYSKSKREGE